VHGPRRCGAGALGRLVRCAGARLELCEALIGCQPCRVPVCLIDVPFAMGDDRHDASDGGRRLIGGGGRELFARRGIACRELRVARRAPFADTASACLAVHHELAAAVATAAAVGELPIVIAGSCDAATGVLGGLARERCGVVWIDAHADFNTPDSTVTGFFPGMALAIVTGHWYAAWWAQIGNAAPVPETHVALFGIRELSPDAERERVERSRILRVAWLDGQPDGDTDVTVATLADRVEHVYPHIDLDALDPSRSRNRRQARPARPLTSTTRRSARRGHRHTRPARRRADDVHAEPGRRRRHTRHRSARSRAHRRSPRRRPPLNAPAATRREKP
jgi:arginase